MVLVSRRMSRWGGVRIVAGARPVNTPRSHAAGTWQTSPPGCRAILEEWILLGFGWSASIAANNCSFFYGLYGVRFVLLLEI